MPRLVLACALPLVLLLAAGCAGASEKKQHNPEVTLTAQQSGTEALLVGISAVNDSVVWVSGTAGTYARTTDGGRTWQAGTVPGADSLQFRDVHAVSAETAYLLSIGPGTASRIYKTTDAGASWTLQFTSDDEPEAFFDCLAFWDAAHGLAFSDAVGGRFVVITTRDGGATWARVPPERLPPALPGEGAFAASGTCVATAGDSTAWIGTGNAEAARVLKTTDRGRSWTAFETPLLAGEGAGITSLAFRDLRHGAALGGDITRPESRSERVAVTADGGRTWTLAGRPPFSGAVYGSAYVPGAPTPTLVAVGPGGAGYSTDNGAAWSRLDTLAYWSTAFARPGAGWLIGPEGRITRVAFRF